MDNLQPYFDLRIGMIPIGQPEVRLGLTSETPDKFELFPPVLVTDPGEEYWQKLMDSSHELEEVGGGKKAELNESEMIRLEFRDNGSGGDGTYMSISNLDHHFLDVKIPSSSIPLMIEALQAIYRMQKHT